MSFQSALIKWYQINKRDLPFRETKDAYKIWLSEIILQQTRVEQGLPYYYKFTERYPDVFSLARASEDEVLKLWQGLGYYSRGRNLLATARVVAEKYNGVFPKQYSELLKLKGIGPYTAAAIASFAFDKPVFVVDGNVSRVLARLFEVQQAVNSTEGKKLLEQIANECGDKKRPALYNCAMMELGALVCTPASPACNLCPLQQYCQAYAHQTQKLFPVKEQKIKIKQRWFYYLMLIHDNKIYIQQRRGNDIWKNLYEFPLIETKEKISEKMLQAKLKDMGISDYTFSKPYIHQLTHRKIEAHFIVSVLKRKLKKTEEEKFYKVTIKEFQKKYAHPRLIEKFLTDYQKRNQ
ncbi:MAG TPA: A/G-specific adenine glycosylase [Bacteroidia bacterium]|nr:A/G-specific adenine glycosylase [Bacteroidetes bacterium CHB6]HRV52060.1 A/G-specific adenine glycosylase [Bacteroidia bacterium]